MNRYVVKESILPVEESEAEKNRTKKNRTSTKDLATLLMMMKRTQREKVVTRNREEQKRHLQNRRE